MIKNTITYHKNVTNGNTGDADVGKFLHNVHQGCHRKAI